MGKGGGPRGRSQDQQTKKWSIEGVIKSIRNGGRSYVVETENGAYLRNRRFIKAAACRTRKMEGAVKKTPCTQMEERTKKKKKVTFKKAVHFE